MADNYRRDSVENEIIEFDIPFPSLRGLYYIAITNNFQSSNTVESGLKLAGQGVTGESGARGAVGADVITCNPTPVGDDNELSEKRGRYQYH